MYHMISKTDHESERRYAVPLSIFKKQMSYLKSGGYTVISLASVHNYFMSRDYRLPKKPVVLTFDDGYIDHYENALPVLMQHNFPATFFVVAGYVGRTNKWRISKDCPEKRLLGWHEIKEIIGNGLTIGSHSVNHPYLTMLSYKDAEREIEDSKKYLEDHTGISILDFSYPYGDTDESIINIVKNNGYKTACITMPGFNTGKDNIFKLKRIDIDRSDTLLNFTAKLAFGVDEVNLLMPIKSCIKNTVKRILK